MKAKMDEQKPETGITLTEQQQRAPPARPFSNQVSTNTGLRRGETRFCRAETKATNDP